MILIVIKLNIIYIHLPNDNILKQFYKRKDFVLLYNRIWIFLQANQILMTFIGHHI